jgi:hypothetical protein
MGKRDPYTEGFERQRMGGTRNSSGTPGPEGLPSARDMDRPARSCDARDRHGDGAMSVPRGIRTIQDANGNGGRR